MRIMVLRTLQVWLVALIVCQTVSVNGAGIDCDHSNQYFDITSGSCKLCTNCSSLLQTTETDCTDTNNTVCSYCPDGQFFNSTSGEFECVPCSSECPIFGQKPVGDCNRTHDLYCEPCTNSDLIYNPHVMDCTLKCELCPKGTCTKNDYSKCDCSECEIGPYCKGVDPNCGPEVFLPSPSPTSEPRAPPGESASLTSLTSALIGIGVVFGIVVFSVVFVMIGLSTSCRSKDKENSTSSSEGEKSVDKLSISGRTSASLISLYTNNSSPTFLDYRTSLEILKQSNGSIYGHSCNSARSSPKSSHSTSVPLTYYSAYKSKYKESLLTPV